MYKNINVNSTDQKGGITSGVIIDGKNEISAESKGLWSNPLFKYFFVPLVVVVIGIIIQNKMFDKKENISKEMYEVESHNQQGGVTAGKIENLILTDKESLGIREPDGLYQNGKKVGIVSNFVVDGAANTFTISEIRFDMPRNSSEVFQQPYEYSNYVIRLEKIEWLIAVPPSARMIKGSILSQK